MFTEIQRPGHQMTGLFPPAIPGASGEVELLGAVVMEILQSGFPVTNKSIIARLLQRLELATDDVSQNTCRNVLERVVHQTDDDIIG